MNSRWTGRNTYCILSIRNFTDTLDKLSKGFGIALLLMAAVGVLTACSDDEDEDEETEQSIGTGGFKSILYKGGEETGTLSDGTPNSVKKRCGSGVWAICVGSRQQYSEAVSHHAG